MGLVTPRGREGKGGSCIAKAGCFFDLKPIAEAKTLKVLGLDARDEDFSDEYALRISWLAIWDCFGANDHHVREFGESEGKVDDISGKNG